MRARVRVSIPIPTTFHKAAAGNATHAAALAAQARELAAFALDSASPKEILTRAEALAKAAVPDFFEGSV